MRSQKPTCWLAVWVSVKSHLRIWFLSLKDEVNLYTLTKISKITQLNFSFFLYFMYVYVHTHSIWRELRELKLGSEIFYEYFALLECIQYHILSLSYLVLIKRSFSPFFLSSQRRWALGHNFRPQMGKLNPVCWDRAANLLNQPQNRLQTLPGPSRDAVEISLWTWMPRYHSKPSLPCILSS